MSPRERLFTAFCCVFFLCVFSPIYAAADAPGLPLAQIYRQGVALDDYWVSEKLDGVRAFWDGTQLISRQGNIYHAPDWFIADFPAQPLDGELWISRDSFERLLSIVRDAEAGNGWHEVRYMVFDLPLPGVAFNQRLHKLEALLDANRSPYLLMVEQTRISSHDALMKRLETVVAAGGEGLMLHRGSADYRAGRSDDLLKVKPYQDAEARVIAHLPGKGKYRGMLGALLVERYDGRRFRLGSGFTDQQRRHPPPIGAMVTYKYHGETAGGLPRFASFLRVRHPE